MWKSLLNYEVLQKLLLFWYRYALGEDHLFTTHNLNNSCFQMQAI